MFSIDNKQRKNIWRTLLYITLIVIMCLMLFPVFIMLSISLKSYDEIIQIPITWFPTKWLFINYIDVFRLTDFGRYLFNSFFISVISSILTLIIAFPAAYACARYRFRGKAAFLYFVLITQMFSAPMILIGLYRTMISFKLIDTYIGLIIIYSVLNMAFSIWLLNGYIKNIPIEIEEAALVDGCSKIRVFYRIIFPLAIPGIAISTMFTFIMSWNEFIIALTLISSEKLRTITIGLFWWKTLYRIDWHYMMASSVISIIPLIIIFIYIQKHLIKGLTAGAYR